MTILNQINFFQFPPSYWDSHSYSAYKYNKDWKSLCVLNVHCMWALKKKGGGIYGKSGAKYSAGADSYMP